MAGVPALAHGAGLPRKIQEEQTMPKYLISASYNAEGLRGLRKDGASGRRTAVVAAIEAMGGKCEAIYYALGEHDIYLIVELPGQVAAAALAVTVGATGLISKYTTTTLLTVEETDQALRQSVPYRGPGT